MGLYCSQNSPHMLQNTLVWLGCAFIMKNGVEA